MLRRWLDRLDRVTPEQGAPPSRLAIAVLLLECARADFDSSAVEIEAVRSALAGRFGISGEELEGLIGDAGREVRQAVSLHDYVSRLNRELSAEDKRSVLGMLWRIAWADGRVDPQEEALVRRIADLLYVSHAVFVQEKLAAAPGA